MTTRTSIVLLFALAPIIGSVLSIIAGVFFPIATATHEYLSVNSVERATILLFGIGASPFSAVLSYCCSAGFKLTASTRIVRWLIGGFLGFVVVTIACFLSMLSWFLVNGIHIADAGIQGIPWVLSMITWSTIQIYLIVGFGLVPLMGIGGGLFGILLSNNGGRSSNLHSKSGED